MLRRHAILAIGVLAAALLVALATGRPSQAEDDPGQHIAYISVNGEGPNAKAWYRGAPPAGVPVQDALDHFAEQGYRVAEVRSYNRPIITAIVNDGSVVQAPSDREENFIILLQR